MANQLLIPFKTTSALPLREAVREYIRNHNLDTHPDAFSWDISQWEVLRRDAVEVKADAFKVQALLNYHAQLVFILTKLPSDIGLRFSYSSALDTGAYDVSLPSIIYERVAVLFNLAALLSQSAIHEDRTHPEGIKRAISYYRNAAGTLSYIIDNVLPHLSSSLPTSDYPTELGESTLRSLQVLMLAQAQECTWQKAMIDHYKNGILAKLSSKISSLYEESLQAARSANGNVPGQEVFSREWLAQIETKRWHFDAAAEFRKSMDDVEGNMYGHELARLQQAQSSAKKGYDIARRNRVAPSVLNDIKNLLDAVQKSTSRAERDNDLIYHQDVPPYTALPPIQEVLLVQSSILPELQHPEKLVGEGRVIFGEMIGWGAGMAIEIFKDRRENWLKTEIYDRVQELDDIAEKTLRRLNLPASLDALDRPIGLPPSLLKKAEEVRLEDGPARVDVSLENLETLAGQIRDILDEAMDILDQESSEDEAIRQEHAQGRKSWPRRPSYEANVELTGKEKRYRQVLQEAADSDNLVRESWNEWEDTIVRLTWSEEELEDWVPSSTSSNRSGRAYNNETLKCSRALRKLLEDLDDQKRTRMQIVGRTQRLADADDIQPRIVREAAGIERWKEVEPIMFEDTLDEELGKYEKFKQMIDDAAASQDEVLNLVESQNEQYLSSRRDDQSVKDRERALQSLDLAYFKYREITRNLDEGLQFYNDLAVIATKFREACKEWVRSRRDEIRYLAQEHLVRDVASLQLEDTASSSKGQANGMQSNGITPHAQLQSSPEKEVRLELPPPTSDEWETLPSLTLLGKPGTRAGGLLPTPAKASSVRAKRTPNILGSPSAA